MGNDGRRDEAEGDMVEVARGSMVVCFSDWPLRGSSGVC